MVYADELSEQGIQRGVEAGHTYVKLFGNDGPDLRFEATVPGSGGRPAIMGDTVYGDSANFTARVSSVPAPAPRARAHTRCSSSRTASRFCPRRSSSDDFVFPFPSVGQGRYRLQVQRGAAIEAVSSPIYLEPPLADLSL